MAVVHVSFIGWDDFERRLGNVGARLEMLTGWMDAETAIIWGAVVPLTPVGVTSQLRGSWATETNVRGLGVEGIVGNPLIYADVIERGRTPGATMPPPDAIARWVAVKIGAEVSAFVVARSIGRKGIEEVRMLQKALERTLPVRLAHRADTISRLLEDS